MIGKQLCKTISTIFFTLLLAGVLHAEVTVSANVSAKEIPVDKAIEYRLIIKGSKTMADLTSELFSDFYVLGKSTKQGYSQVNNTFESTITQIITLRPKQLGKAIIPSFKVTIDGQNFETNPFVIKVLNVTEEKKATGAKSTLAPAAPKTSVDKALEQSAKTQSEIFVQAFTDKTEAYKGEVIRYQLLLFKLVPFIRDYNYELPDFSNFSIEVLQSDAKAYSKVINNRRYYVQEIARHALIAHKTGELRIDPSEVNVQLGAFYRPQNLKTNAIPITIKDLPAEGKPENFSGLVGDYSLTTHLDDAAAIQNKPLSLRLKVSGYGDLKQINEFNYTQSDDYKIYKSSTKDQVAYTDNIQGIRELEYIVVPKTEGPLEFPQFSLSCFSPKENRYYELRSPTKNIEVVSSQQFAVQASVDEDGFTELAQDLRYIHSGFDLDNQSRVFYQTWIGILTALITTLTVFWYLGLLLLDRGLDAVLQRLFKKRADVVALKAISKVEAMPLASDRVLSIQNALFDYLADIIGRPANALTIDDVVEGLKNKSVPDAAVHATRELMELLAFSAYSPKDQLQSDGNDLLKRCRRVIEVLKEYV